MLTKKESLKNEVKSSKKPANPELQEQQKLTRTYAPAKQQQQEHHDKSHQKTRITVKYNVGYGNQLYIRGKGANLNWDKGTPLKNVKADEWIWETETSFSHCEFKVLINDKNYENGENHYLNQGANLIYTPHFYH